MDLLQTRGEIVRTGPHFPGSLLISGGQAPGVQSLVPLVKLTLMWQTGIELELIPSWWAWGVVLTTRSVGLATMGLAACEWRKIVRVRLGSVQS